jgi:hypothetical protein
MISPAMDEFLASLQYLQRIKHKKLSTWKAFWAINEIEQNVIFAKKNGRGIGLPLIEIAKFENHN